MAKMPNRTPKKFIARYDDNKDSIDIMRVPEKIKRYIWK
jgi:hypothetical protein